MRKLTVSRDLKGTAGLCELPVDDILFFESHSTAKEMIILHTRNEVYYTPGTLKYWLEVLKASGEDFEMVDRANLVHLSKIHHIDRFFRIAYFDENKSSKKCTISINNVSKVLKHLARIKNEAET
ncbi:MAG: LytTR family DNA-binding domain-containing protein [Candidatus Cohnella colombiensis]|uniref:LytTR family DNA-binding domain-containing protein n=1 Tax=Candidatus Cohnella colombiensis TaxID=3121368 RepID=A0AA95EZ20_9BACL|nr:MAG: LytTR family DNA-binding domain-containing protein [Cohnella sp.]